MRAHRDVDAGREVWDEGVVGRPGLTGDVAEYFLRAAEPFYTEMISTKIGQARIF